MTAVKSNSVNSYSPIGRNSQNIHSIFAIIALSGYIWLVLMAWFIVYPGAGTSIFYLISAGEILLIASVFVSIKLLKFSDGLRITASDEPFSKSKFFLKCWIVSLLIFLMMYAAFYPGGFSPDSLGQYAQASSITKYSDWHPVIHTLVAFTLPLKLSGGWTGSIVLFQIILASFALSYSAVSIAENGSRKYAALFLAYVLSNSATLAIVMFPWKDVHFAFSAMVCMTFAVKVYFSGGEWLKSWCNVIMFVLFMSVTTLFRHNGILFTFPLLVAVMVCSLRKQRAAILAGCIVAVAAIRFVLYPYIGVEKPGYRITEITCLPMAMITTALYEAPNKIDSDIKKFIHKVAGDNWKDNYVAGNFNSIKFSGISWDIIEEAGYSGIFGMTARCLREAPLESLRGFAAVTLMVYGVCGPVNWPAYPRIYDNDYGITYGGISLLRLMFLVYYGACRVLLKHVFCHTGIFLLFTITLILARADFMKFLLSAPILTYDFGTMLFLGGPDFRFFYSTYLVVPIVIFVLLRDKNKEALA